MQKVQKNVKRLVGKIRSRLLPSSVREVMRQVQTSRLTYLSEARLSMLASICLSNETAHIPGVIIETGCALGGSSILMAASKTKNRPMRIYDVFGMIPPPSSKDGQDVHERYEIIHSGRSKGIGNDAYYGYVGNLYQKVIDSFCRFGYPADLAIRLK